MLKGLLRFIIAVIFYPFRLCKSRGSGRFFFQNGRIFRTSGFQHAILEKFALLFSIIVVVLELFLGFMLLLKLKLKFTLSILIALCIFFGFFTFYSAYFNVVTDCGCFGDAIKFLLGRAS